MTVHVNGSVSAFNYVKGKSTLLAPATSSNTAVGTRPTRIVLNGECGFVIVHCEDTPQTLTVWDLNTCTRLLTFAIKLQPELAKSSMDNGSIGCDLYRLWSRIPGHWSDDASDGGPSLRQSADPARITCLLVPLGVFNFRRCGDLHVERFEGG